MNTCLTDKMKTELVSGLRRVLGTNLQKIILYGSVARGEATESSDIDIAVIVQKPLSMQEHDHVSEITSDMDLENDCFLSIVDIEQKNIAEWGHILPYYKNMQKEGITLWTQNEMII